jgi:hypothetical protein
MSPAMLSDPSTSATPVPISLRMSVRLRQDVLDVESVEAEVRRLVGERQRLRDFGASAVELERNRAEIVGAQLELGRALIRRYLPTATSS